MTCEEFKAKYQDIVNLTRAERAAVLNHAFIHCPDCMKLAREFAAETPDPDAERCQIVDEVYKDDLADPEFLPTAYNPK